MNPPKPKEYKVYKKKHKITHDYGYGLCPFCNEVFKKHHPLKRFCSSDCASSMRNRGVIKYDDLREYVFERDNFTCVYCNTKKESLSDLHAHHKRHLCKGGLNNADNLVTTCISCHKEQHKIK